MNSEKRWYIWARVSTSDQHAANQLPVLRAWAEQLGGTIAEEFVTEDSAWASGNGNGGRKGQEFERKRFTMLNGLHRGDANGVLMWSIDRISRQGPEDMLRYLRLLAEAGGDVRSHEDSWLNTSDPFARQILISVFAALAQYQSDHKSKNIKLGIARVRQEIADGLTDKTIGGRKAGAKDRRRRRPEGYEDAWRPGGKLYEARQQQLAEKKAKLLADPVRLRELRRDVPCEECSAGIGDPCRRLTGKHKGATLSLRDMHTSRKEASDRADAGQAEGSGEEQAG